MKEWENRDKVPVSLKIPRVIYNAILIVANKFGLPFSSVVILALHKFLDDKPEKGK